MNKDDGGLPGALVAIGDYYGSLAAARCLGTRGIKVWYADHRRLTTGTSSAFVHRRVQTPPPTDMTKYGEWLEQFGKNNPGLFLYAASDDMAFILSSHRERLAPYFAMYQPSLDTIMTLLDKSKLARSAEQAGLRMPKTWAGATIEELLNQLTDAQGPVLIKPKTQVGLLTKGKKVYCATIDSIGQKLKQFMETERYSDDVQAYDPSISTPLVQTYHASAVTGMLSVAGFVSKDVAHPLMLCSQKVFQRPRRLGVGIGFEAHQIPKDIATKLVTLCQQTGYFGIFEAEFVIDERTNEFLLVDFNPRYYGQMAFEIWRGLPLPALAYYSAIQNKSLLDKEIEESHKAILAPAATSSRYALGWIFRLMLWTQRAGGAMKTQEYNHWVNWHRDPSVPHYDAIAYPKDAIPMLVDILLLIFHALRHPRDFYRKFFKTQ